GGEESFIFLPVELFVKSERRRKVNPKKYYIVDTGYSAALGYDFSIGRAMENAVLLELKRREREVYYWKEYGRSQGREVDFVISKDFRAEELVQVTYSSHGLREREVLALKKARAAVGAKKTTVITWDYSDEQSGVGFTPLWYWLLD
ncbi:MAG: ATP-binding protein, partial [Nitrososphaerota archaeon]|nr:ATP-binding protein [Nitrososphaerota archaeon]